MTMTLKRVAIILVAVSSVTAAACARDPETVKRQHIASGKKHLEEGNFREAVVEFRNALKQDPRFGEAHRQLAEAYFRLGDTGNAGKAYIRAADLLPDDRDAQLQAGGFLLAARRFEDARSRAEKVLQKEPRNINALILVGYASAGLRDFDRAVAEVEEAIQIDPTRSETYTGLGGLQLLSGRREEAEAAFKNAVQIAPESVNARLALANYYWAVGRPRDAEDALKRTIELDPKSTVAHRALGVLYVTSNRLTEAEKHLKAVVEFSQSPGARFALADYYLAMRRYPEAAKVLQLLVDKPATSVAAKSRLAVIEYSNGRRDEAHRILDAIPQKANLAVVSVTKAQLLLSEGNFDQALATARRAAELDPRSAQAHFVLGRVHVARHEAEEARQSFTQVLALNPRATEAQLHLSRLELARGRINASIEFAEAAIASQPRNLDARLARVQGLLARRETAAAEAELKRLLQVTSQSSAVHTQFGMLYLMKSEWQNARTAFSRALDLDAGNFEALRGSVALDLRESKVAEARMKVEARLARVPRDSGLLLLASSIYARQGDVKKTEEALRKALEAAPSNPEPYRRLAKLYFDQGRLDEARQEFENLAKRQPKLVWAHTVVATILEAQQKHMEARKWYERALEIDSSAAVAANNLAWMYASHGENLDIALQLAQTAKRQLPDHPHVNDTLGWIYYLKNLPDLAVPPLEHSVKLSPENPILHFHLGLAYTKLGDKLKARRSLEQALKLKPQFEGAAEARRVLAVLQG
jgi:putative PEP-CTERM system TPR-repeat lipoprotein